jgi:hypothetical protein
VHGKTQENGGGIHVHYNGLPSLEKANGQLQTIKGRFRVFLRNAISVVENSRLARGQLGAFLLHRHWNLQPGHVMVERPRLLSSGKVAMITAAIDAKRADESKKAPCRWMVSPGARTFMALEESTDPSVIQIAGRLQRDSALMRALCDVVLDHGLQEMIGYMVIPRKSLVSQPVGDYLETNLDGLSIVTREILSSDEKAASIKTGWPLARERTGSVWACCYCSHGGGHSCTHPMPDPPVCQPHGCV